MRMPNFQAQILWYPRLDSNLHDSRSKRDTSYQLGYVGNGAGCGDRTRLSDLEGRGTATIPSPHKNIVSDTGLEPVLLWPNSSE